jgi:hypothetical protein
MPFLLNNITAPLACLLLKMVSWPESCINLLAEVRTTYIKKDIYNMVISGRVCGSLYCVVLVGIYLFQAISGLIHLDLSGYTKI